MVTLRTISRKISMIVYSEGKTNSPIIISPDFWRN